MARSGEPDEVRLGGRVVIGAKHCRNIGIGAKESGDAFERAVLDYYVGINEEQQFATGMICTQITCRCWTRSGRQSKESVVRIVTRDHTFVSRAIVNYDNFASRKA